MNPLRSLSVAATILLGLAGSSPRSCAQQQASSSDTAPPVTGIKTSTSGKPVSVSAETKSPSVAPSPAIADDRAMRIEGEKRFSTNCGRCHMAPHKFSPRIMATAVRHMRVRAMITDEDMRLILRYLTQ
jgi:hypothetical protein